MKYLILSFFIPLMFIESHSQSCGNFTFNRQGQIDSFPLLFPACTETGAVIIEGSDILNLNGLIQTEIMHSLFIKNNPLLNDLSGLDSLLKINMSFLFINNDTLSNLSGLNSLEFVGQNIQIEGNDGLIAIDGIDNLDSIKYQLNIFTNAKLERIGGFNSLEHMGDVLNIQSNPILTDITSIQNAAIGALIIVNNSSLSECSIANICNYLATDTCSFTLIFGNTGNCVSATSIAQYCGLVPCGPQHWKGCGNSFWSGSSNWEKFLLPTDCSEVIIETGFSVEMNIDVCINTLEIASGTEFSVPIGRALHVLGPESCGPVFLNKNSNQSKH